MYIRVYAIDEPRHRGGAPVLRTSNGQDARSMFGKTYGHMYTYTFHEAETQYCTGHVPSRRPVPNGAYARSLLTGYTHPQVLAKLTIALLPVP